MHRTVPMIVILACGVLTGLAQSSQGIQWLSDPGEAVAQAKKTELPLMCYVLSGSKDRDDKLETAQRKALADRRVLMLAQRFVCVRLSRSRHQEFLKQLNLDERSNMEISFVEPDGTPLDKISPGGVGNAETLAQKMALVFKHYRQRLFDTQLRAILENADAKPGEILGALQRIKAFTIEGADATVAALLDREGLDAKNTALSYDVLAHLSTKIAVTKLLERASAEVDAARDALAKCTPAGAELMLDQLMTEQGDVRLDVYRAVVKACKINSAKPDKWWANAKGKMRDDEIGRVTGLVRKASERWKQENEEYR